MSECLSPRPWGSCSRLAISRLPLQLPFPGLASSLPTHQTWDGTRMLHCCPWHQYPTVYACECGCLMGQGVHVRLWQSSLMSSAIYSISVPQQCSVCIVWHFSAMQLCAKLDWHSRSAVRESQPDHPVWPVHPHLSGQLTLPVQEDHSSDRQQYDPNTVLPPRGSAHPREHTPRHGQGGLWALLCVCCCLGLWRFNVPGPGEAGLGAFTAALLIATSDCTAYCIAVLCHCSDCYWWGLPDTCILAAFSINCVLGIRMSTHEWNACR